VDALTAFHFLRPGWLLVIPLWLWLSFYVWRRGQNGAGWAAVCDPALLRYLVGETEKQQHSKAALPILMLAGSAAVTALAGPAWKQLPQPVYRAQSALVIGLDLSRSMLAEDMKPNRLERAKQKLRDILRERREGQTALVVFAGAAFDVVPLTSDNRAILAMLEALEPAMMPVQGSRASTALEHAEAIFKRNAIMHGAVLLLTDGVDAAADDRAAGLAKAGHRVSVIGVGTHAGAPIPASGQQSGGGFVKDDQGNIVIPRLRTDLLTRLADAGRGVYQPIRFDDQDIHAIPGLLPSAAAATKKQEKLQTDLWREEGPWLLLLLVLPLMSLAFRRGVLLSMLLLPFILPAGAHAMSWKDLWQRPDQQGQALMQQGDAAAAAGAFQNPEWKGASLYRAKKYRQAAKTLAGVDSADGWYNRGNALARAGDLKAALDAYEHALKLDKTDRDARFNRDLVKKAMRQSEKKKSGKKQSGQKKSGKQKKGGQQGNRQGKQKQEKQGGEGKQGKRQSGKKDQGKAGAQGQKQSDKQQAGQKSRAHKQSAHDSRRQPSKQPGPDRNKHQKEQQAKTIRQADADKKREQHAAHPSDQANDQKNKEASAALRQWLRRIPDDPGGLLRRKFLYQYQQQKQSYGVGSESW